MTTPNRRIDSGTSIALWFPYIDGDGQTSELQLTLYRRAGSARDGEANLVVVLDGDEFIEKTRLPRFLEIGETAHGHPPLDVLSVPPGYGDRSRNEKYLGAGEHFLATVENVCNMVRFVAGEYYFNRVRTLTIVGASLTGRAALDITAAIARRNREDHIFERIRVCAVAPSFWQLFRDPLRIQLRFMVERWWVHRREDSVEAEVARREEMMAQVNRRLVHDIRYLYDVELYIMISYTEYLRFSGDIPGANLEEMIEKIRHGHDLQFPNLRKFFRLLVHFDKQKTQHWVDYLSYRLREFTIEEKKISPRHYDVYYPDEKVCNVIYKDGHTWSRWTHLFREVTNPSNTYVPNLFID